MEGRHFREQGPLTECCGSLPIVLIKKSDFVWFRASIGFASEHHPYIGRNRLETIFWGDGGSGEAQRLELVELTEADSRFGSDDHG
jgi:hypothetical protein